jgi:hypothetical protein
MVVTAMWCVSTERKEEDGDKKIPTADKKRKQSETGGSQIMKCLAEWNFNIKE